MCFAQFLCSFNGRARAGTLMPTPTGRFLFSWQHTLSLVGVQYFFLVNFSPTKEVIKVNFSPTKEVIKTV